MVSPEGPVEVPVRALLTGLDSAILDFWVAARSAEVAAVAVDATSVVLRSRRHHESITASAPRRPGRIVDALDEALRRLHSDGAG